MAFWFLLWLCFTIIAAVAQAKNTTDPAEARVINSMFSQWGIPESAVTRMGWNISGELCSGTAVNSHVDYMYYNASIKCDCNFPNSTCHITGLSLYEMDIVGTIPEGLWTLTYLTYLDLFGNYLTGPLSPSIGNLTRMRRMYISTNALSGHVPPELGQLTDLRALSFSRNNFNGSLPSELGNLSRLGSLNFRGNSFEGSIPASFSRLTSLQDLSISGLSNGTLDFIQDLKSLTDLMLRNNRLSGPIPNNMGEFVNLTTLDLSFNNLSGPIPTGLFNLWSLSSLSLGNNSLTGTLPDEKGTNLDTIDLSYNELSGTLPSWANDHPTLQLNLVANNFTLNDSGLNCLQRGFPCGRGSPRYSKFGINCGGPKITSSDQIVHEQDNKTLGPATYYLDPKRRWAVSIVERIDMYGIVSSNTESTQHQFNNTLASTLQQFTNAIDSGLFQTARKSTGSLRYYGLALENGNYTVKLQFAEIEIADGPTWGRRVFDIYIQGTQVFKDFDIKMAVGGASFNPVTKDVTAEVLNNYLEVHLLWAEKGTYGPLISAISATPNFIPTVSDNPPSNNINNPPSNNKKNNTGLIVGILVLIAVIGFLTLLALYILRQRRKRKDNNDNYDEEFMGIEARPYTFCYEDLRDATDDFSPANKLGEGGFGPVYKGTLDDGRVIAVKQLSIASHHGKNQFVAEIATISAVQHRNLVKLYGCCIDGEKRLLVYEYLENKSLDQALFGSNKLSLTWYTRFEICMGIARGLAYLHAESRIRIIHRDVKSSNVLLDCDMNPKISDFGLAKLYDDKKTHLSTRVAGTIGYLAPEYAMLGQLTEKADVFGFGIVVLEIISGRSNSDSRFKEEKIYLLEWAWNLHEENREIELVDEELLEFDLNEVKRVMRVALLCTQTSPTQRPSMSRVVTMLLGDIEASGDIIRPEYLTGFRFEDVSSSKSTVPNSTSDDVATTSHSSNIISPMVLSDIVEVGR